MVVLWRPRRVIKVFVRQCLCLLSGSVGIGAAPTGLRILSSEAIDVSLGVEVVEAAVPLHVLFVHLDCLHVLDEVALFLVELSAAILFLGVRDGFVVVLSVDVA